MSRDDDEARSLRSFLVPMVVALLLTIGIALFLFVPSLHSKSVAYLLILEGGYVLNAIWIVRKL